jgi:hypothetical protein
MPRKKQNDEEDKLVRDLRAAGFRLSSIWDWVNSSDVSYVDAEPILLRHLASATDERLVEGIARSLTDKVFRQSLRPLIAKFPQVNNDSVRWAIADAICVIGFKKSDWQDILKLAADPKNGPDAFAKKLGLTVAQVFPISYDISKCAEGLKSVVKGRIKAERGA